MTKEERYDEWLDDVYGEIQFGYLTFYPSQIIKELDPIAYRVGYNDFLDMIEEEEEEYV